MTPTFLSIGTGPGIGFATAERFARERFRTILSARNTGRTLELAAQLQAKGYEAEARTIDASNPASVLALIKDVGRNFGQIDVLHYNAASLRKANLADQPADTLVSDLAVNIGGALAATQAVAATMASRGSGTILLTGGGLALRPQPEYLSLSIGKAAIRTMAQALFEDFKRQGVHIATVTVMGQVLAGSTQAAEASEKFWQLHSQPPEDWQMESTYIP